MTQSRILITGGAGFIGSNLALRLVEKGYVVTVLDNLLPQIHGDDPINTSVLYQSIAGKVDFLHGSVTQHDDWVRAIADNEVVIHLAAETGTGQSMYHVNQYVQTNIGGTAILLDVLTNTKTKVKKVIVASSRALYGEGKYFSDETGVVYPDHRQDEEMKRGNFEVTYPNCKIPLRVMATDEGAKIHPSSIYGITKQAQEQMVLVTCASIGISALAFRYQNVYGPGQSLRNPYTGILSIFSTQIKNNLPINVFEDGKESRDFVYIDDVINATVLGIQNESTNGEVFNVGSGVATSVASVAEQLLHHFQKNVPINITGNYRLGDIRHNYADLTKIKEHLGFLPSVSFSEGLKRFCEWVNEQPVFESRYSTSLNEMKQKGLFK